MFTSQKILGLVLVVLIIGTAIYFTVTKFKQEVSKASSSPQPSPSSTLEFLFNKSPTPVAQQQTQQPAQQQPQQQAQQSLSQPSERPYFRNKYVGKFPGILTEESLKNKKVTVSTNKGVFEIEIFPDTPLASSNFLLLSHNGFYDGLKFHKVEKDFYVQGGDPLGNGTGGPGYTFADEAVMRGYTKGMVASFNIGPNTNGSQFFILLSDKEDVPKRYTIFGRVLKGMDVLEKLVEGDIMQQVVVQSTQ